MDQGAKITHRYFSEWEYIQKHSEKELIFEDGRIVDFWEFFTVRTGPQWNYGYSVFDEDEDEVRK
jgi:hypothetical protein